MYTAKQTTLITGASAGIGVAFARLLAARGDRLILTARRTDRLQKLADELSRQYATESIVIPLDLGISGGAQQLFSETERRGLTVDFLVNNAGFGKYGMFGNHPIESYQQMIQLNIGTVTDLCYLYLKGMRARRQGGILNVASLAAFVPTPYLGVYGATKAYVLSLSQTLAIESQIDNVQVSVLCPGSTATEFGSVASDAAEVTAIDPRIGTLSAEAVARIGLDGFNAGKIIIVSGLSSKATAAISGLVPRSLMRRVVKRVLVRRNFRRSLNITTEITK